MSLTLLGNPLVPLQHRLKNMLREVAAAVVVVVVVVAVVVVVDVHLLSLDEIPLPLPLCPPRVQRRLTL